MKKREALEQQRLRDEIETLAEEVSYLHEEMAATLACFSAEIDPDLVDYYTYYYKAAEIKHGYLLKRLKKIYYADKKSHVI